MMYECQDGCGLIGECGVSEDGERICPEHETWVSGVVTMVNELNTDARRFAVRFGYASLYQYVHAQTVEDAYRIAREERPIGEYDDRPVTGITDNESL